MDYYRSQPPMAGLSSALAMQGRMGDSTLVHMNPMEVEMLKTMSPDGSLSINPETGLPEAFKLKDLAAFALPIAASIAFPMLAPSIGLGGLSGVATGAIGAGLGGFGAGLIQGKGVGDSLIQGGLSGLMSYGMGSAFAPAAPSGGITSALPEVGSTIDATQTASGLGLGGYNPAQSTFAYAPEAAASDAGLFAKLSANLQTPIAPETLGGATYGSALTAGGSGLLSSGLLAPEEMPYDIDGMDDMDAYYASRIPDLEAGRRRGRAAARSLNYPPSGGSGADYYSMATSPGGFGTFYAADGGRVPKDVDINGQPHQLSYINQEEANLLQNLGGSGREVFGIPAYMMSGDAEGNAAGTAGAAASAAAAAAHGMDPMGVVGNVDDPSQSVSMGLGANQNAQPAINAAPPDIGPLGRGALGLLGLSPQGYSVNPDMTFNTVTGLSIPGIANAALSAMGKDTSLATVTGQTQSPGGGDIGDNDDGGVGDFGGDSDVYGRPYGDPYNTSRPATMAQGGGIASLAYGGNPPPTGYANQAFEGTVPGVGTGMSDDVPFSIEGDQPALLSRDEYVLPADVVSQLGDGSSGAGSDMLDNFISQVRQTKYGNTQQPPPVGPQLMTGLMRSGGIV